MSSDPQTLPAPGDAPERDANRALIANVAGWAGLLLIFGWILYWAVTGNSFDLPGRVVLILALLALGTFGLLNPQGIIDLVAGRATRNVLGTVLVLALGIGILVAVNILYGEIGKRQPAAVLRTDLTAGQQNSLSPQSIRVAQEMTGTVTAYGFFGTRSDEISTQRTADNLLKEYQKYTDKIHVQFINPDVAFGLANQYGLTRYDVVVFDNGTRHEVATANDETNFTGALLRLRNNVQKKIAILNVPSPLSFNGGGGTQTVAASLARSGLDKENYIVLPPYNLVVSPTISTKDVDVMIVPPSTTQQPLSDTAVRALISYLDAGGHVLLIGDPLAAPLPGAILQKYGLSEARGIIVERNSQNVWGPSPTQVLVLTYPSATITRDMNNVPTAYLAAEPIIAPTTTITGFTVTPFIQSGADAAFAVIQNGTNNQPTLQIDPNGPKPPLNIGVTVEQTVADTNNFTSTQTTKPLVTRLAVVGDYDFVSDQLTSQVPGNLDMFNNTVNWLSQSEERISVRPKDTTTRSLILSDQQQNLIAWSTIVFLPMLILLGGGVVWWRRR